MTDGNHHGPWLILAPMGNLPSGWAEHHLLEALEPTDRVWFLVDSDQILGGIRLRLRPGGTAADVIGPNVVVDSLSVESAERGKGYGRLLMEHAERWLLTQPDLPHTLSLAVETNNRVAISLYRSMGYRTLLYDGEARLIRSSTPNTRCYIMFKDA
ncbi:MAG: GNAT family N-acetyltransferase [Arachnia sp.]